MFSGNLTGKTDRRSAWHSISGFCLALPNCHLSIVGDPGVPWTKCCVYAPCSNVAPSRTGLVSDGFTRHHPRPSVQISGKNGFVFAVGVALANCQVPIVGDPGVPWTKCWIDPPR